MPELLLELFSEEIPARMQGQAARDLEKAVTGALADRGLLGTGARAFAGPRRLTLVVDGLAHAQSDMREERKGPRADAPEAALQGFLRSVGLTLEEVERRATPKGDVLFAVIERKGRPTAEVLAEILPEIVKSFPWPKSMRWGSGRLKWVRPLKSILCVFNGEVVPFEVEGIASGDMARGHRFMGGEPFRATRFSDYRERLEKSFVLLDAEDRKARILEDARNLCFAQGLELVEDERLADEVAGLVEWPVPLLGRFEEKFLALPEEVLTTVLKTHQRTFSVRDAKTGKLANAFVCVANIEAEDGGKKIREGNARVIRARLSDAMFFYEEDLKVPLETRVEKLKDIVFHEKLGTLAEKVHRISQLAPTLSTYVQLRDPQIEGMEATDLIHCAARLAKADLVTHMVFEFPELQGVMGSYYAERQHKPAAIAKAIRGHYSPLGPNDQCPTDPATVAVALADKIDTLVGFWAIDEKPTGSRDPFALRRAALGIVRLVREGLLTLPLVDIFKTNVASYKVQGKPVPDSAALANLRDFIFERLSVVLRDEGVAVELIRAVTARSNENDILNVISRVKALQRFLSTPDGESLLAGYRRAANILAIEEKKDSTAYAPPADRGLLDQREERALADAIDAAKPKVAAALAAENFEGAMRAVAALRGPVDAFFEKVTVNAPEKDLRANRLKLLAEIRESLHQIADFSKVEG